MAAEDMVSKEGRPAQTSLSPVALSIAGSDSSAGAGIQADLKTFSALGVYGLTAVTGIVAETPGRVLRIEPASAEMVRAQIEVLFDHFPITALKTGLLFSDEIVLAVAQTLRERFAAKRLSLVIDPVMVATSGDSLLRDDVMETYSRELFPLAALITPNLAEAARFLGEPVRDFVAMRGAVKQLAEKFQVPVLLKGGHLEGETAIDLLFVEGNILEFSAPFVRGIATHGTGCTYSAAIVAGLATGLALEPAVQRAKQFVTATISGHLQWETVSGESIHALNHSGISR